MAQSPRNEAVNRAKRHAKRAGYRLYEGSYSGTTDDRLGRFYFFHVSESIRPYGEGYATRGDAWIAAAEHAERVAADTAPQEA
jgi:hypothetical protein